MICKSCQRKRHKSCKGKSWCDCQHDPTLGAASRQAQERLRKAQENHVLVEACENKDKHTFMTACASCPYGSY